MLVISSYTKRGYIGHRQTEHASIPKTIETLFDLPPLNDRDATANDLLDALDFTQSPRAPLICKRGNARRNYWRKQIRHDQNIQRNAPKNFSPTRFTFDARFIDLPEIAEREFGEIVNPNCAVIRNYIEKPG